MTDETQKAAHDGIWITLAVVAFVGLCVVVAFPPAQADWITPSVADISVHGNYTTYFPYKAVDGDFNTSWVDSSWESYFNWTNPGGAHIDAVRVWTMAGSDNYFTLNSSATGYTHATGGAWFYSNVTDRGTASPQWIHYKLGVGSDWANAVEIQFYENTSFDTGNPPTVTFDCTPLSGPMYTQVACNATATNSPDYWNWTFGDGGQSTEQNPTRTFNLEGIFDVNVSATNTHGTGYLLKPDYITIGNTTATVRTYFQNVDGSGAAVYDSDISIYDVNNASWTNVTAKFDGTSYIDTPADHTLNGYGHKTGYTDGSRLGVMAWNEGLYEIRLEYLPDLPTPADGDVVLIMYVNDATTKQGISLASVKAVEPSGTTNYATTQNGKAIFQVPNQSLIVLTASKTGYSSASKSITTSSFGPDTVTIEISPGTPVPTGTAPTPTPTGSWTVTPTSTGGPSPTATIPPECVEDPNSDACHTAYSDDVWSLLYEAGPAIMSLAICAILLGLLKMIMKF